MFPTNYGYALTTLTSALFVDASLVVGARVVIPAAGHTQPVFTDLVATALGVRVADRCADTFHTPLV